MLDINPDGKKLILSIDGGGLRGMLTVAMLAELESITGKTCPEIFDMVAGTSTGAIIAAGIGLGLSAQQLLEDIYRQRLPDAFRHQPHGIGLIARYLFGGLRNLYDLTPFIQSLAPFAAGKRISDFSKPIVFMTTRDVRTANTYFMVSKGPGARMFQDYPVAGAVGASGAAPIFFAPVLGNLIDGGVGVNGNPCLAATIEAMEYIKDEGGFRDGEVIHFSFGTGYLPRGTAERAAGRFWLVNWLNYVISDVLNDTLLNQVQTTRTLYRERVDFRRYNPYLELQSVRYLLGVDAQSQANLDKIGNGLSALEPDVIELMEAIGRSYASRIHWTEPNYMPWWTSGANSGQGRDGGHPLPGILPVDWAKSPFDPAATA